jgi:hypothetical protein
MQTAESFRKLGLSHLLPGTTITIRDLPAASGGGGNGLCGGGGGGGAAGAGASGAAGGGANGGDKETELIGSRASKVQFDGRLMTYLGKHNETFDLDIFEATEGVPKGACAPTWCCKSPRGYYFCNKKGQPGHTTPYGGAHAVKAGWRGPNIPLILVATAAVAKAGSVPTASHTGATAWWSPPPRYCLSTAALGGKVGPLLSCHSRGCVGNPGGPPLATAPGADVGNAWGQPKRPPQCSAGGHGGLHHHPAGGLHRQPPTGGLRLHPADGLRWRARG